MGLVTTLKERVNQWRWTEPYHYACTVCERAFQTERTTCPDCGGTVERVGGEFESATVDPSP
jgi:rRNA maturation endonuclease Nob1